ncbi:MAG: hypothetical protein KIT34_01095 [Cyanobacteria bacterium TGS_CYA1]|nr:hypothetical protein [Cyanobacteria bacterium TGS_CYA1]
MFFPPVGVFMFVMSFLKRIRLVQITSIVLFSLVTLFTAPLVIMDFIRGSTIKRGEPVKVGNKNVVVYTHLAFRLRDEFECLCVETNILPGVCLSKEIYSEHAVIFHKVDESHIEIDVSCGYSRTVAI